MNKYPSLLMAMGALACLTACDSQKKTSVSPGADSVKIMTLDPGHFHAALVQKNMSGGVDPTVHVFAPEGADVDMHLQRIEGFNTREEKPTHWKEEVYKGKDFFEKMIASRPGNVMVTAGNNGKKTKYISDAVSNGINVFADKPMAIDSENFELLKAAFDTADAKGVMIYDIMTERFEITTILQRALALDADLFGSLDKGTPENPAVTKESVHHFLKTVAGKPLVRPEWYFDVTQQGEGIVDVTTHLVDLVQWESFPNQTIDYKKDVEIVDANRWTTPISLSQYQKVTGADEFPSFLSKDAKDGVLNVYANGDITYKLKGVCAKVSVIWNFEPPAGTGDTHYSLMRGSKASVIIRQGAEQNYVPCLYVEPAVGRDKAEFEKSLRAAVDKINKTYPGLTLSPADNGGFQIVIPDSYRVGHEAHFGQVTQNFIHYFQDGKLPAWEKPNMLSKYYTTTQALKLAREKENSK